MSNLKLSQGLEVLRPKADKALPVPCNEWDVLREKIDALTTEPWFFHTIGSTLLGVAMATTVSIWTGAVVSTPEKYTIIAWAVVAVCAAVGAISLLFAHQERKVHKAKAADVSTHMKLIEQRFEREEI